MTTITLRALSGGAQQIIDSARISDVIETRFGGCGIVFKDAPHPLHFWESKEQVLQMLSAQG